MRHPQLRVQFDHQRDDPGTELHARRAQRVGGLQDVAALHPPSDTASSGRPRCRSAAPPDAPRAVLPGTATPRGSLRPRPRNPGTSWEPAPRGSRQSASGAAGSRDGHTSLRSSVRVARRFLAAGPWQLGAACRRPARRASSNCRFRRSTRSFRRSFSRCRRSLLRCSLFTSRSRRVNFLWIRSTSASRCSIRFPSAFRFAVATPTVMPQFPKLYNCQDFDECGRAR